MDGTSNVIFKVFSKNHDLFAKVSCTYCQEEINGVRIQCCECLDFDICLQCFIAGAEIGPHRNDHPYKFVDHCAVSIFGGRRAWTGREHLKLLDAVELYAYGNWELVAKQVETRTSEECKEEYISRYLDGNIGRATWGVLQANHKLNQINHVPDDNSPLSPNAIARLPPLDVSPEEAKVIGYKPHRDDFDIEYNPEAEQIVAGLEIRAEDETEIEKAVKLSVLDIYIRELRERARRKRIVRDYQLVAKYFKNARPDSAKPILTKQQKELQDKMRCFAQYMTAGEHERLVASIERERELRHRLAELCRYRSLGLTTQEEIVHYEQHAAFQRSAHVRNSKSDSSGHMAIAAIPPDYLLDEKNETREINSIGAKCMWLPPSEGCVSFSNNASSSFSNSSSCFSNSNNVAASSGNAAAVGSVVDVAALPMGSMLSSNEAQLCTNLNLEPVHYTTLKSLIIQDNLLSPGKYKHLTHIESNSEESSVKEEVIKFLGQNGWLPDISVN